MLPPVTGRSRCQRGPPIAGARAAFSFGGRAAPSFLPIQLFLYPDGGGVMYVASSIGIRHQRQLAHELAPVSVNGCPAGATRTRSGRRGFRHYGSNYAGRWIGDRGTEPVGHSSDRRHAGAYVLLPHARRSTADGFIIETNAGLAFADCGAPAEEIDSTRIQTQFRLIMAPNESSPVPATKQQAGLLHPHEATISIYHLPTQYPQ